MAIKNKLKFFGLAFIISLFFWWGINALEFNLEQFFFAQTANQKLLTAQVVNPLTLRNIKEKEPVKISPELSIDAKAALSVWVGPNEHQVLFEKNGSRVVPIASLTKLMTSLVVYDLKETYTLSQVISITNQTVEQQGKSEYGELKPGEKITVKNLIAMALIESSNDAAFALSEPIGEEAFVDLMNIYADKLNLENTTFFNPVGYASDQDPSENYSTAYDLANLTQHIFKNHPQILEISAHNSYQVLKPNGIEHHFISENTNKLLEEVPGIVGGKTGYTEQAKGCLVIVLESPQFKGYFINIILGSENRFEEMKKLSRNFF